MRLRGDLHRAVSRARRRLRPTEIEQRVAQLGLAPGDLAIDCGANVGNVTLALARRGAEVHAFEPDPDAFAVLRGRVKGVAGVHLHRQAVSDRPGKQRLYRHVDAATDPVRWSVGSSLLPFKGNVDAAAFVEVETVDLAAFVLALHRFVEVIKLDVEGVECGIVHRLLDSGAIERVGTVLVEVHERHIPQTRPEVQGLRERLARDGLEERVRLDWT